MSLFDLVFKAAGGGVLGAVMHLGTAAFEVWKRRKDAEVEIMLLNAKVAAAEKEAAWNAFAKSQEGAGAIVVPGNASTLMVNIYVAVDALRNFTRPGLTWALLAVLVYVYATATQSAREQVLGEITFGAFTALFWWFGSRYTRR